MASDREVIAEHVRDVSRTKIIMDAVTMLNNEFAEAVTSGLNVVVSLKESRMIGYGGDVPCIDVVISRRVRI